MADFPALQGRPKIPPRKLSPTGPASAVPAAITARPPHRAADTIERRFISSPETSHDRSLATGVLLHAAPHFSTTRLSFGAPRMIGHEFSRRITVPRRPFRTAAGPPASRGPVGHSASARAPA